MGGAQRRVHGWVTEEGPWVGHRGGSMGASQGWVHGWASGEGPLVRHREASSERNCGQPARTNENVLHLQRQSDSPIK